MTQVWKQNQGITVRNLKSYEEADNLRRMAIAGIKAAKRDHLVKVRRRPSGLFDVLVFDRLPTAP